MKLFRAELHTGRNRIVRDLVVWADDDEHVARLVRQQFLEAYPNLQVRHVREHGVAAVFVTGSWTTD